MVPMYNHGSTEVGMVPGPMAGMQSSPDVFTNGEIPSVHFPNLNMGTGSVRPYASGGPAMTPGTQYLEMGSENVYSAMNPHYNMGEEMVPQGGGMMAGPMMDPQQAPNFGYIPSGPTREEIHADMAAAGKENRAMMQMENDERRKQQMHELKMAEAKEMGAVKVSNAKKGPMARGPGDK